MVDIVIDIWNHGVLINKEDWERLKAFTWCIAYMRNRPYIVRSVNRKRVYMHHDIIGRPPIGQVTDHINNNSLDNRRANLRHVTYRENNNNRRKDPTHTCVHFERGRYRARPYSDGKQTHIGVFDTKEEALQAVKAFYAKV